MNHWKYIGCCLLLLAAGVAAHAQSLLLLSPNGGEQWLGASQQVISWTYSNVDNIDIQYSGDNGLTWTNIIEDYPSSALEYTWTVPAIGNNQSLIRIISALSFTEDQSDGVFTIPEPTIELLYPVADSFETGTIQYVEWITSGIGEVLLQYSINNGQTWTDVNTSPAEHQYANWYTPNTPGDVQLRIYNVEDITKQDVSGAITITQSNPNNPAKYAGSPWDGYDMSTSLPSTVTLLAPNGGEVMEPYSTFQVEWSYTDVTWVDLAYSTDNGSTWTTIASQLPADALVYDWEVPNTPSTQCMMRVSASPEDAQDISNSTFVINPAGLVLTYPNAGESFDAGTIQYIEWDFNGVATVLAEYSVDNGQSWVEIGTSPAEDRYINWVVPNAFGSTMLLRLSDQEVPTTNDQCDLPLPCVQPFSNNPTKYAGSPWDGYSMNDNRPDTLEITSPNGGEVWMSSSVQQITWTYNNVDQVTLEYTIDDGDNWDVITNNIPASQQSFDWTVPTTPSNLCRVRISENTRPNITDLSDNAFIIPTGYVQITYPNGGESFGTGTIQYIEWEHSGLATVKLEYSTDDGSTWIVIGTSPANDRYMNWFTPAAASTNCRIRISDIDNGDIFNDESNVAFAVVTSAANNPTKYAGSPYDGYSMYAYLDEYVKVVDPNGGEFWGNGSTQQIQWLVLNNSENLMIEYTTDGEESWTTLLDNVPNTPNTFDWSINATPSNICKVRATTLNGQETDKSDYFFTIANPTGIITNSISGGSFCPGNTVQVTYSANASFNADNQFIVKLSDSLGQFNGPVENIGSVNATSPVPITATIPVRYYTSDLYRLRVIATSPPTLGPDNGVDFTINPLPAVELGNEISLCAGDVFELDATNASATYLWSTGSTNPSIFVDQAGTYSVTVTNACGTTSDTVDVDVINIPYVNLGLDVQICQNNVVVLEADSNSVSYTWSTGANTSSIIVSLPGNYTVTATNQCGSATDQINVSLIPIPDIELGNNFGICPGDSAIIDAFIPGATYVWSDGSNSASIAVYEPGIYWVNTNTICGVISDQIVVFDGSINLDAGDDIQMCEGATASLMATGGNDYQWSNGMSGSIIEVSPSQNTSYTVISSNIYGCNAEDEVMVIVNPNPDTPQINVQGSTTYCSDEPSVMLASAQSGIELQWMRNNLMLDGSQSSEMIAQQSGDYSVQATNTFGCTAVSEFVQITVNPISTLNIQLVAENGVANFGNEELTPGLYDFEFVAFNGCDSIVIVQVIDPEIQGCTILGACNYNPIAGTEDNSSCLFPDCTDSLACNYNPQAGCPELSLCIFPESYFNCLGQCINDSDSDGTCDELEIIGCTDIVACNFNPTATNDDASCVYPGCTDLMACNYDATAGCDNGSCIMPDLCGSCTGVSGCMDTNACNYSAEATCDDGSCTWLEISTIEGDNTVVTDTTVAYAYVQNPGSTYSWSVTGGDIVGLSDIYVVVVAWGQAGVGEICVTETTDSCVGQEVCLEVVIDPLSVPESNESDWLIYPNPSTGLFRLVTRDWSQRSYEVFDAFGKLVHNGSLQSISTEIDLTSLASGHYMIKCGTLHKRIVIVR